MAGLNPTKIEWVRGPDGAQGFSWNPVVGCTCGCAYCYARRIATTRLAGLCPDCAKFRPHMHGERVDAPALRMAPAGIFVCSMGELFDPEISVEALDAVLSVMAGTPRHRYYLLTKQRAIEHFRFPSHVWVGVSLDGRSRDLDILRVEALRRARCDGIKFVSYEPLIGPPVEVPAFVKWVIIGAESGRDPWVTRPEWVESIVMDAARLRVPVFVKDNLAARGSRFKYLRGWPREKGVNL